MQTFATNEFSTEKTNKGKPQYNGVAESIKRTLNEHARCMRLHVELPKTC